jgi:hypothetical protein
LSNRLTPEKQSRRIINVQRSPITATERAIEQRWPARSSHFKAQVLRIPSI